MCPVETDILLPHGLPAKLIRLESFSVTLILINSFASLHLNVTLLIRLLSITQVKWMLLLHYLFLSPLILLYLS